MSEEKGLLARTNEKIKKLFQGDYDEPAKLPIRDLAIALLIIVTLFLITAIVFWSISIAQNSRNKLSVSVVGKEDEIYYQGLFNETSHYTTTFHFEMENKSVNTLEYDEGIVTIKNKKGEVLVEISSLGYIGTLNSGKKGKFFEGVSENDLEGYINKIRNVSLDELDIAYQITAYLFSEPAWLYFPKYISTAIAILPATVMLGYAMLYLVIGLPIITYNCIQKINNRVIRVLVIVPFFWLYFVGAIYVNHGHEKLIWAVDTKGRPVGFYDEKLGQVVDAYGQVIIPTDTKKK